MTDEEREVLEILEGFEPDDLVESAIYLQALEKVKNLIKKQSKEIEHQIEKRTNQRNELAILNAKQIGFNKLKNTVNSYKGQFKKQQKEIEELKEDSCCMTNCVRRDKEKLFLEDKIKAKIEEIDKVLNEDIYVIDGHYDDRYYRYLQDKQVLQSLLEKE